MKRIQWTHLKKCTGNVKSIEEYLKKYPDAEMVSEETRKSTAVSLENMIKKYGETLGNIKFKEYCERQSKSNSFEYKNEKHGWSLEEFNSYNLSRAITSENMIKKYGREIGLQKYEDYCNKQSTAGVSLEYFINKYGKELGEIAYYELNLKKVVTLDTMITRYGEEFGTQKYINKFKNTKANASKSSQIFLNAIYEKIKHLDLLCYFASNYKEYFLWNMEYKKIFFYDFLITDLKFCLEYNGDLHHANPKIYKPNDIPKFRGYKLTAKEIWEKDRIKRETLLKNGYKAVTVWESDVMENFDECVNRIVDEINELYRNK